MYINLSSGHVHALMHALEMNTPFADFGHFFSKAFFSLSKRLLSQVPIFKMALFKACEPTRPKSDLSAFSNL